MPRAISHPKMADIMPFIYEKMMAWNEQLTSDSEFSRVQATVGMQTLLRNLPEPAGIEFTPSELAGLLPQILKQLKVWKILDDGGADEARTLANRFIQENVKGWRDIYMEEFKCSPDEVGEGDFS